jgi:hypothetical protein
MALTITATVDPTSYAVRLTITGGTPDYVVDAAPAGDRAPYRVRSTYSTVPGDPSARVALDGDVPLNTPTQWVVTDRTGATAQTTVVEVSSTVSVLADALDPDRSVAVTVVSQPPHEWAARSVWWDVLGQREPFASIAPMRLRAGELVLRVEGSAQRRALMDVMVGGSPLVLRSACPDAVDDLVLLPESVRESLVLDDAPTGPRHVAIQYQTVSRELGPYTVDAGRTYAQVVTEQSTYATVLAVYPDYAALLAGDPNGGLGAEQLTNGSFTSGLADWSTFWTSDSVTITAPAGTAVMTSAADGGQGLLTAQPPSRAVPAGSTILRVTGKVRSTSPGTSTRVELVSNKAPGDANYFQGGAVVTSLVLSSGPAWSTFAVDVALGDSAHDVWTVVLRASSMAAGAVVEWDDVSARWRA